MIEMYMKVNKKTLHRIVFHTNTNHRSIIKTLKSHDRIHKCTNVKNEQYRVSKGIYTESVSV